MPAAPVTLSEPTIVQAGDERSLYGAKGSDNPIWTLWYDWATKTWGSWSKGSSNPVAGPDFTAW